MQTALSYDDILLTPQQGVVASRSSVDPGTTIGKWPMRLPVFSSPMETVTDYRMALAMGRQGCIGVMHRFGPLTQRLAWAESFKANGPLAPVAIAIGYDDFVAASAPADILVLDVAHADSAKIIKYAGDIKRAYPEKLLVAGSVATYNGARRLLDVGVDILRVGIGAGAACTTRTVTGFGVPMVTSIMECDRAATYYPGVKVMADGGIKNTGDILKALAVGADYVMMGRMFAGTDEAPHKGQYFGQASSKSAGSDGRHIEGAHGIIYDEGSVEGVLASIEDAIRSGVSYGGGRNIAEFQARAVIQRVSPLGMAESGVRI